MLSSSLSQDEVTNNNARTTQAIHTIRGCVDQRYSGANEAMLPPTSKYAGQLPCCPSQEWAAGNYNRP